MVEDNLWIDIVYARDLELTDRDIIVNIVTREGLREALDAHETALGQAESRERIKVVDRQEMVASGRR